MSSPTDNGIKLEQFAPTTSGDSSAIPQSAPATLDPTKIQPQNSVVAPQQIAAVAPPMMNGNGAASQVPNGPGAPMVPPQQQILPQLQQAKAPVPQQTMPSMANPKTAPSTSKPGGTTSGTIRSGNGGGGQLLQFPWKLHEMLHLAEKNGKTDIISWLPGGNGFKVHDKEKFCAEIMPGYFASQKYKTFQRSLNLWGFESVAKGPDRGACYHQYFVKGHPELCHNMTRVKIKGQSNPRTPAAAAAAAAAAAKRAAMSAAMSAANQQQVQQLQQAGQGLVAQQQQMAQQQQGQQPLNMFAMNQFANMGMMGMPMAGGAANANIIANPYALAMNNVATINALQQLNPALAAAAMQNPAMNAMLSAQVRAMAVAQQQQQQQQLAPMAVAQQRQGGAPGQAAPVTTPGPTMAPGVAVQQQQMGMAPAPPTPAAFKPLQQQQFGVPAPGFAPAAPGVGFSMAPAAGGATNANANANYAGFLARKANMDMQQQQELMPTSNGSTNSPAPGAMQTTTKGHGNMNNNYNASDGVVDDLVAV